MVVITVSPHPRPAGTTGPTRTFGVEEELLLVDAVTLKPAAAGAEAVCAHAVALASPVAAGRPHLVPTPRVRRVGQRVGLVADEQPTCGFHIHVCLDAEEAAAVPAGVLREGPGARRQRAAFAVRQDPRDVVHPALEAAHR